MTWLEKYQPLEGVRLNMVVDSSGKFTDASGSSRGISNENDRSLLVRLRKLSDVYVTGGNTARLEGYKVPTLRNLAIITSKQVAEGIISLTPRESVELTQWVIDELHAKQFKKILLEVGPKLAKEFLSKDRIDEFCLTVVNGDISIAKSVLVGLESTLDLVSVEKVEDTLFTRWRRGNK